MGDLSVNDSFESPLWHKEELEKTTKRIKDGDELIIDWKTAKQQLLKQFA